MANSPTIVVRKKPEQREDKPKKFVFGKESVYFPPNSSLIADFRQSAFDQYQQMQFPNQSEEAWRRTPLTKFNPDIFGIKPSNFNGKVYKAIGKIVNDERVEKSGQLVVDSNSTRVMVRDELQQKGVILTDLRNAEREFPHLVERVIAALNPASNDIFMAMARAFAQNGVILYIPKGVRLDNPIHTLFIHDGGNSAFITNLYIILEEDTSASLIHEMLSPPEIKTEGLHIGEIFIMVGERANFTFYELQNWAESIWNFTHEKIIAKENSSVEWVINGLGSKLTKSFINLDLVGKNSAGKVSGITFSHHQQHLDYDTQQNHLAMQTQSDLIFKSGLKDESRTIWQGMIFVAPGALKTDGYQLNRNLVLSQNARVDSIPGLEILADDVRCSHGMSVSTVDSEQIFYLKSRGIPQDEANRMIVEGFFDPILQKIPYPPIRNRFKSYLINKL